MWNKDYKFLVLLKSESGDAKSVQLISAPNAEKALNKLAKELKKKYPDTISILIDANKL